MSSAEALPECYLDSIGVQFRAFDGTDGILATRFKLSNDATLRNIVLNRLRLQLFEAGLINQDPSIKLVLVCGKIVRDKDQGLLREHFGRSGWLLWDAEWLKEKLKSMSKGGYENSPVAIVAKLLLRSRI